MKRIYYGFLFMCVALLSVGCSSDDGNPIVVPPVEPGMTPPSAAVFKELQKEALNKMTQRAKFYAEDGLVFVSEKGAELNIPPQSILDKQGNWVEGEVELEFIEFYDKASMVLANKPLMGNNGEDAYLPLITGGQFYINVTQNGINLQGNYYNMMVPAENTGGLNFDMTMWEGIFNEDGNLEWTEFNPGQELGGVFADGETNSYQVYLRDFGWTNIDILASMEGEKTPIVVKTPDGYDNKNSAVYVAYKGEPGVLAYLDVYSVNTGSFTEHYGWGPIGFEMYVIFVSESNGGLIYAIQEVKLEKNKVITIAMSDLRSATEAELSALIKALP